MTDTDKPVKVTEDDLLRAGDLLLCASDNFHARRDALALAFAEMRERAEAKLETAITRWAGQVETHQARIAELEAESKRLRCRLKAPGLYQAVQAHIIEELVQAGLSWSDTTDIADKIMARFQSAGFVVLSPEEADERARNLEKLATAAGMRAGR